MKSGHGVAARCAALVCNLIALTLICGAAQAQSRGIFQGELVAKFDGDGRHMIIVKPFSYVDPAGRSWKVPAGTKTDGASIPRILWTAFPPFTGKYRSAAVIHDYYCLTKERSWQDTHQVFYHAMRTAGVQEQVAMTMYGAVYYFGPRWGVGTATRGPGALKGLSPEQEAQFFKNMEEWIAKERPTLRELTKRLDEEG
jgi:hypothetical protein